MCLDVATVVDNVQVYSTITTVMPDLTPSGFEAKSITKALQEAIEARATANEESYHDVQETIKPPQEPQVVHLCLETSHGTTEQYRLIANHSPQALDVLDVEGFLYDSFSLNAYFDTNQTAAENASENGEVTSGLENQNNVASTIGGYKSMDEQEGLLLVHRVDDDTEGEVDDFYELCINVHCCECAVRTSKMCVSCRRCVKRCCFHRRLTATDRTLSEARQPRVHVAEVDEEA